MLRGRVMLIFVLHFSPSSAWDVKRQDFPTASHFTPMMEGGMSCLKPLEVHIGWSNGQTNYPIQPGIHRSFKRIENLTSIPDFQWYSWTSFLYTQINIWSQWSRKVEKSAPDTLQASAAALWSSLFVPEWGCYLLECSWNEIHLLFLDCSQGLGTDGKIHLPSADLCGRFVSALYCPALKLTAPEQDLLHNKMFDEWFWGGEAEEIPKKWAGYSQQGMLDAATPSLGSPWWAPPPPNRGLHKTSKEN